LKENIRVNFARPSNGFDSLQEIKKDSKPKTNACDIFIIINNNMPGFLFLTILP
jgi:hypothetical protein